jgi:hypothetical protein
LSADNTVSIPEIKDAGVDTGLRISSGNPTNAGHYLDITQGYNTYIQSSHNSYIGNGTNATLLNMVGGNIGVGVSVPDSTFHVRNASGNCDSIVAQYGTGTKAKISAYADSADLRAYNGANKLSLSRPDGENSLVINTDGHVVTPYQPFALVDFGGPSEYTTMSGIAPFDNIVQNQGNHYNTSTYRFTCPTTGVYQISSGFISQNASDLYHVSYQKNGTRISRNYTTYRTNQTSMQVMCQAGDYLDINLEDSRGYYQGTGTSRYCWASYMLLG